MEAEVLIFFPAKGVAVMVLDVLAFCAVGAVVVFVSVGISIVLEFWATGGRR